VGRDRAVAPNGEGAGCGWVVAPNGGGVGFGCPVFPKGSVGADW
jgi:hypothetical protein